MTDKATESGSGLVSPVFVLLMVAVIGLLSGCQSGEVGAADPATLPVLSVALGGSTTAELATANSFSQSARNLSRQQHRSFEVGDSLFNRNWVVAPSSTSGRDGLGPTFNAVACSSCHLHDGRGNVPGARPGPGSGHDPGLLFRLSLSNGDPVPSYGSQLQDRGIPGVPAEGRVAIEWREVEGEFEDGAGYVLLSPEYRFEDLNFGPLPADVQTSPRLAPPMIGLGLLEAIPEATILSRVDPEDKDGDGISGRANFVSMPDGSRRLGRFGLKANAVDLEMQIANALLFDMGLTSSFHPLENCPEPQQACRRAPDGGSPEVDDSRFERLLFYTRTLAVPSMRDVDDEAVRRGAQLFVDLGCESCHTRSYITGDDHPVDALRRQQIFPYSDLLLHDMGEGLADGRPDHEADGREWRTSPLWGIGLTTVVTGEGARYLHDGRARSIEEAILWHGGEAEQSKESYRRAPLERRAQLLRFLEAL